jgi:outer membrane receptor for monomeric catechols
MNVQVLAFAAAAVLASAGAAQAGSEVEKSDGMCADGTAKVWVTGSAIKRCVKFYGSGTLDTPSPVFIIGRRDMDDTGRNTVSDVLKTYPSLR